MPIAKNMKHEMKFHNPEMNQKFADIRIDYDKFVMRGRLNGEEVYFDLPINVTHHMNDEDNQEYVLDEVDMAHDSDGYEYDLFYQYEVNGRTFREVINETNPLTPVFFTTVRSYFDEASDVPRMLGAVIPVDSVAEAELLWRLLEVVPVRHTEAVLEYEMSEAHSYEFMSAGGIIVPSSCNFMPVFMRMGAQSGLMPRSMVHCSGGFGLVTRGGLMAGYRPLGYTPAGSFSRRFKERAYLWNLFNGHQSGSLSASREAVRDLYSTGTLESN